MIVCYVYCYLQEYVEGGGQFVMQLCGVCHVG